MRVKGASYSRKSTHSARLSNIVSLAALLGVLANSISWVEHERSIIQ